MSQGKGAERPLTADELAEFAFVRELRGIDAEIQTLNSQLRAAHERRERLLTGKSSFINYVKAARHFHDPP